MTVAEAVADDSIRYRIRLGPDPDPDPDPDAPAFWTPPPGGVVAQRRPISVVSGGGR